MYGFTGVPAEIAMLPLSAVAETTTAEGRRLITMCAEIVPRQFPDLELVYGDTDSVIFKTSTTDLHEGHAVGVGVEKWLNAEVLPSEGRYLVIECEVRNMIVVVSAVTR
jgi:DNA polymerase elongation subunit (family B)